MIRALRIVQLNVLLLLMQLSLQAQVYPVQVVPQLLPPYTLNLSEYYQGTQERLVVLLTNTDLTKPNLQVRLKMSIQGQNAKLKSRDGVYYPPITLDGGAPQRITLADLAPYFNIDNLELEGITRSQFQQSQKLPEGFYQFCFEAYEYNTNRLVGRSNCAMAWMSLLDPPLLNLPRKTESIAYKDPANIIFQWTPRNMGSPTAAFNTEYEFTLVELWDNGIAPEAAFGTMQPLYRTTTQATTLLYGPAEPLLIPGKRYGWRIRAQASDGSQNTDAYRNNGYSEIYWFTYQRDCPAPFNLQSDVSEGRATITWNATLQQTRFAVDYREKGQTANQWYSVNSSTNRAMLYDLKKDKQYEYRVGAYCDAGNDAFPANGAVYSDIKSFTIDGSSAEAEGGGCNILQPELKVANREPIQTLMSGDVITAGDFPVKLITVQGQGNFTGTGYITIPFIGKVAVKVRFSNITVNTDKQLIGGVIETTYDAKESQIADLDKAIDGGGGAGVVVRGVDTASYYVDMVIPDAKNIHVDLTTTTDSAGNIVPTGGATLKVTGSDGAVKEVTVEDLPATVKDKNGTIYGVDKDGHVTKVASIEPVNMTASQLNTLATDKAIVKFIPHEKQQYAFDEYQPVYSRSNLFKAEYEQLNGNYYVSSKAIVEAKTDVIKAVVEIKDNTIIADSIRFVTGTGTRYESSLSGDKTYEIKVVGGPAADAQALYALYPKGGGKYLSLGKLLIASYPERTFKLVLVPVNGASVNKDAISQKLDTIYKPVGISFQVTQDDSFNDKSWDLNHDDKLAVSGSGWLSTLTNEMKALNSAYTGARTIQPDAVYLFVLNSSDSTLAGDMPRGKQFGYLFTGSDGKTAAHEIGHGLFKLKHAFDNEYGFKQGELPSNVMDYPNGDRFAKYQWNQLYKPGVVIGLFERDGDGQNVRLNNYLDKSMLNNDTLYFSFLTPDGKRIYLPKTIKQPVFAHSISTLSCDKLVAGTLIGFTIVNGTTETKYSAAAANNQFAGYYSNGGTEYPYTVPANVSKEALVMMFPESATSLRTVKFTIAAGKLSDYVSLHNSKVSIVDERALGKTLKLFSGDAQVAAQKSIAASNSLLDGLYNSLTEEEADLIEDYDKDAELLPMLKVAAWIKLYPVYYNQYTSGIENHNFCSPTNGGQQCRIWEKNEKGYELMDLRDRDKYEFYCVFLDSLKNYCAGFNGNRQNVIATLSEKSDWKAVIEAFAGLNDVEMQQLSLAKRLLLLKFAIKNDIQDFYTDLDIPAEYGFERVVVRLFKNIPGDQRNAFLDSLVSNRDFDKKYPHLLAALCKDGKGLDSDEWKEFATILNEWIMTYKPRTEQFSIPNHVTNKNVLIFDNSEGLYVLEKLAQASSLFTLFDANPDIINRHYSLSEDFIEDGRIAASSYKDKIFYKADVRSLTKKPYEYIWIYFKDNHTFSNGKKMSKGAILPVPAFMVYSLFNDVNKGRIIVGVRTTVDIALLFVGIGELNAAIRAAEAGKLLQSWRFYKSLADLTVSAADIVINDALGDKLANDPTGRGQKILYYWNIASLTYSFGRLSYEGIKSLKTSSTNLSESIKDYKGANKVTPEEAADLRNMEKAAAEMADEAASAENALLEAFLNRHNLKGSHVEALLANAGQSRAALMIQMGGWESSLFEKLNTALGTFRTLESELIANPALFNHFHSAHKQWWYKYALLREDYLPGNAFLPPGFRQSMEDLETLDGVRLRTINPNNKLSDLGNLFEDDLIEEVGRGFRSGNFDHLPPDVRQKMQAMYNDGYTIMITQSKVDLNPHFTTKPQPDMLFFKVEQATNEIIYTDAIYIDGKLSTSTGFSGAQKDLKSLAGTNKQVSIFEFAHEKNPEIFTTGNYNLNNDFLGRTITVHEAGKIGTEYKNNIFNVTYKP
jgi:TANFOR domain-containing protein